MQLPNITVPESTVTLPVCKKVVKFRPFIVKENKILLTALEGYDPNKPDDQQTLVDAVFQILNNCVTVGNIKVEDLPIADVEFLFVNLRKKSIGEQVEVIVKHEGSEAAPCGHYNTIKVSLDKAKVIIPEGFSNKVMLTDKVGLTLKYPTLHRAFQISQLNNKQTDALYDMVVESIDQIFNGDDFAAASEFKKPDLVAWLEQMGTQQAAKIFEFFNNQPYLSTEISYACEKCKQTETKEVRGTTSFFI